MNYKELKENMTEKSPPWLKIFQEEKIEIQITIISAYPS